MPPLQFADFSLKTSRKIGINQQEEGAEVKKPDSQNMWDNLRKLTDRQNEIEEQEIENSSAVTD